jgi:hypothetical protein
MPRFVPSSEQRTAVAILSGAHLSHDELCRLVINPRTGKSINERTLLKCFPEELRDGKAKLKGLLVNSWLDIVKNGQHHARWAAVEFGLRMVNGWRDDAAAFQMNIGNGDRKMKIQFVTPNKVLQLDDDELPRPQLPAPKTIDVQANKPSSNVPIIP